MDHCSPVSDVVFRQRLRSASSHQLSVPRHRLSTYGRRAFSVAGPTVWISLPDDLRDPECSGNIFRQSLKTFLFSQNLCVQRIRGFDDNALYKFTFDIWLRWLLSITDYVWVETIEPSKKLKFRVFRVTRISFEVIRISGSLPPATFGDMPVWHYILRLQ